MELEEQFRNIIQRKYHILEKKLDKYELVKGQATLLLLIKDNNGITQNELASLIGIKESSMSVRLNKLEKLQYIEKKVDENSLKKKRVFITPTGKTVSTQCRRILNEVEKVMFKGMSKKEISLFENSLNKIEKNLK